jgi:hypothetical protein
MYKNPAHAYNIVEALIALDCALVNLEPECKVKTDWDLLIEIEKIKCLLHEVQARYQLKIK